MKNAGRESFYWAIQRFANATGMEVSPEARSVKFKRLKELSL